MSNEIKLQGILNHPTLGRVGTRVRIIDGVAIAVFSDNRLGKELYLAEKKTGNNNVSYHERTGWYEEKFPEMSKQDIAAKLMKELKLEMKS